MLSWLNEYPNSGHILVACLNLIECGDIKEELAESTVQHIVNNAENIDNPNVLNKIFICLKKSSINNKRMIINKFFTLFDTQLKNDTTIRPSFIKFVELFATDEQIDKIILQTKSFLRNHSIDKNETVWAGYLTLLEKKRPYKLISEIEDVEDKLIEYPNAQTIRQKIDQLNRERR